MKIGLGILTVLSLCQLLGSKPIEKNDTPQIVSYEFINHPNSSYFYSFETTDGQSKKEFGDFIDIDGNKVLSVVGTYQYIGDDGQEYSYKYTAGKDGFHIKPDDGIDVGDRIGDNVIKTLLG